jgi:hypothetical protein
MSSIQNQKKRISRSSRLRRYESVYEECVKKALKYSSPKQSKSPITKKKTTIHDTIKCTPKRKKNVTSHKQRRRSPTRRSTTKIITSTKKPTTRLRSPTRRSTTKIITSTKKPTTRLRSPTRRSTTKTIKNLEEKNKRPLTKYQKFVQSQSKKSKYKGMCSKERMQFIGSAWKERKMMVL